ncbi:proteasome subunit beta type-4 [Drosophila bipectinata]|uniref:proteasome subunit beta type-4 n=1 Tax=Drosophila bipectinata TaxID=42026 RepID=UPI001C89B7ED|nr:proteasome subunit beta type-4 [Drosophila bipectinata]
MLNNYNGLAQPLWQNGPTPGQFYHFTGGQQPIQNLPRELTPAGPYGTQRNTARITTGSSVLGIRFDGGVMIAADTMVSYGSLSRYQSIDRVFKINEKILLGGGDDFADIQSIKRTIDQKMIADQCSADDIEMKPKELAMWLTRVLYNRRTRMNPLFIDVVVGGVNEEGQPLLANVDLRGRFYEDYVVATGFARHLAIPLVRERKPANREFTAEEATTLIRKCMEVLYYRDTRNTSKYTVGVSTASGTVVEGPYKVDENWKFASTIKGY